MSHKDERRRLPRRRTLLSAAAVYGERDSVVACTVRDKSVSGARLLLEAGGGVPDAFYLIELTTGELHAAKVVWRDSTFVGVTFSESISLAAPKTPEHKRLAELRARLTSRAGAR
jgi:hypothetical protein